MNSEDITLVGILLACGGVVHLVAGLFPTSIIPNFAIIFYCLAVVLTTPKIEEALGIGVVAGIIFALVSHSIYPLGNLISEPVGALVFYAIYVLLSKYTSHAAGTAMFYAACASGFTFVLVALIMAGPVILVEYSDRLMFFISMSPIVLATALVNLFLIDLLLRLVTRLIIYFELSEF
jgi:energy-coupling factor transport system ATP-binding protein